MGRPNGTEKTGGRQKGTPNKDTFRLAEALLENSVDVVEQFVALLPQLEAGKRADVLLSLMSYLYPKRKSIEIAPEVETQPSVFNIEIVHTLHNVSDDLLQKEVALRAARKTVLD